MTRVTSNTPARLRTAPSAWRNARNAPPRRIFPLRDVLGWSPFPISSSAVGAIEGAKSTSKSAHILPPSRQDSRHHLASLKRGVFAPVARMVLSIINIGDCCASSFQSDESKRKWGLGHRWPASSRKLCGKLGKAMVGNRWARTEGVQLTRRSGISYVCLHATDALVGRGG